MGGGGRFVPLIGDTHPLSLMPSRNMVKYATNTQNSSKSTVASAATCKRLFDWLMSRCARTISIRFTFSSKHCEYPSRVNACLHCSTVIRSDGWDLTSATWSNTRRTALKWNRTMNIFAAYRELSQKIAYDSFDAIFCGTVKQLPPDRMALVCCKPVRMSSSTGNPRRFTNSRNICWLLFRSVYSLQNNKWTFSFFGKLAQSRGLQTSGHGYLLWWNCLIGNALIWFIRMQY